MYGPVCNTVVLFNNKKNCCNLCKKNYSFLLCTYSGINFPCAVLKKLLMTYVLYLCGTDHREWYSMQSWAHR